MYVGSCEDRFSCEEIELVSREGTTVEAFENNFQQVLLIERYYRFDIEGRERERERERLFHWTVVDINSGWRESGGVSVTSQSQLWRDANAVQAPPTSSIETVNILQYVRRWSFAKVNTSVSINVMGAHAHGSFEVESPWSKLRRSLPASKVRQHVHNDKQRERERKERKQERETYGERVARKWKQRVWSRHCGTWIRVETELDSIVKSETMTRMLDSCGGPGIESTSAVDTELPHFQTVARTRSPNLPGEAGARLTKPRGFPLWFATLASHPQTLRASKRYSRSTFSRTIRSDWFVGRSHCTLRSTYVHDTRVYIVRAMYNVNNRRVTRLDIRGCLRLRSFSTIRLAIEFCQLIFHSSITRLFRYRLSVANFSK